MSTAKCLIGIVLIVFLAASCATTADHVGVEPTSGITQPQDLGQPPELGGTAKSEGRPAQQAEIKETKAGKQENAGQKAAEAAKKDQPSQAQDKTPPAPAEDRGVILNLEDVTLVEFSEVVFIELLKKNYMIAPSLKDQAVKISVRMTKSVPADKLIPLVKEILKQYNVYLIMKEGVYTLVSATDLAALDPELRVGRVPPAIRDETGMILQIIPLDHIGPSQIDYIIKRYLSRAGTFLPEPVTNSLVIIDFPDRIAKVLEILNILDREIFENMILKVIKPRFWEPAGLVKQVTELMRIESIPLLKPREQARGVFFVPIERLGEIYIFATSQEWLDRVLFFVESLDKAEALGGDERVFLYFPTNTSAAELGSIMSQMFGQSETPAVAAESQTSRAPTAPAPKPQAGIAKKLMIDEPRNALIFIVSPSEWTTIRDLLERLDIPAKQVLIEAVIGELTLDDQFRSGFEWFMKNNGIKAGNKTFTGQGGTEGGLGLGSVGLLYSLVADDNLFRAAINAFISQNKIKIISAPRILGVDNKESVIRVGTEVPVVTSEAVTGQIQTEGTTGLLRSIQYRNTGVILTVKPTIHSGGNVSLDLQQEVSEAQTNTISAGIQSPLILTRSIKTSLVAKDGQTVFIGGLISKNVSSTRTGIPILSQIPLIGELFKSRSQGDRRTELIVLLTVHIVSDASDLDYMTEEFRDSVLNDIKKISIKRIKDNPNEKK
jgi:general secretion pathway protein D